MTHKACCGPNTENPPTFEWDASTQYLHDTDTIDEAQREFAYYDPKTDTSNQWDGQGDFQDFLAQFDGEATDNWRCFKVSAANMVAWNCGKWGPQYESSMDVRGNSITIPGADTAIWNSEGEMMHVSEWPYGGNWKRLPEDAPQCAGWYYDEG